MRSLIEILRSGLNFSFGGSSSAVGLSIGASSIKVVELAQRKKQWILKRFASVPLSEISSDHREISNPVAIVSAIQSAMKQAGITSKDVCSAISGTGLIIKNLSITVTDMKELQDQVFWEAEQYIPYDIAEVVVDFQVIGKPKENQVDVILVAVKKAFLEQYMSAIQQAKLNPKVMDTELFALQNTFESNYDSSGSEATLLADVGALSTKIVICANGTPHFTKDAGFGGLNVTQEIQRELNLPKLQDAEALKVSASLPQEVRDVLMRSGQNLAAEIKKATDFYTASSLGPPVTKIFLSGGGSRIENLNRIVQEFTGISCEYLNPFHGVGVEMKSYFGDVKAISPEVVIPMGLAIRAGAEA